ncbi:MAG: PDZ domain-containing protein [Planctomycetes bacterium]|nr:PDZ domain-containing protein [Planctomycetota bacterium]
MKSLVPTLLTACLLGLPASALLAADAPPAGATKPHEQVQHAFLGVAVSSIHPALAANLNGLISPDQGLAVEDIVPDSPAAKAGLKIHDILTIFDDQKLFTAEQLSKLVHSDRPGREATVGYLRDGKLHQAKVTLGQIPAAHAQAWSPVAPFHMHRSQRVPRRFLHPQSTSPAWDNFDSLSLKKLGDNRFRAEVQYLDKDGKTQKHVFEGTREEIRKDIDAEKDLKPEERAHLLRSLNLHNPEDDVAFPGFWFEPGWTFDPHDRVFK